MNLACESAEEALRVMGDEPLFAPLRILKLLIRAHREDFDVAALAAAAAAHPSLKKLTISSLPLAEVAAVRLLMDMAVSKLTTLLLRTCDVLPDALPELARLLGSPSLKHLQVSGLPEFERQLFVGLGVSGFCTSLRASGLVSLDVSYSRLFDSLTDGLALLSACTGHPTLRSVGLCGNTVVAVPEAPVAVGDALASLVAAGSILTLNVAICQLGEAGLRPLFFAVAGCVQLQKLECSFNAVDAAALAGYGALVLAAAQQNSSLVELDVHEEGTEVALEQAMALVSVRGD